MVSNDLARRATTDDVLCALCTDDVMFYRFDLLGSWSDVDLTLTWSDLNLNLKTDLSRSKSICSDPVDEANTMVPFLFSHHKLLVKSHLRKKTIIFNWATSGATTIESRSNLIEKSYRSMKRTPQSFFESFLAIILLEIITIVCKKTIFSKFDLWWPLLTWTEEKTS